MSTSVVGPRSASSPFSSYMPHVRPASGPRLSASIQERKAPPKRDMLDGRMRMSLKLSRRDSSRSRYASSGTVWSMPNWSLPAESGGAILIAWSSMLNEMRVGTRVSPPLNITSGSREHSVRSVLRRSAIDCEFRRMSKRVSLGYPDRSKRAISSAVWQKTRTVFSLSSR